ncbi:hypothetical protein M569_01358 [Genlisea aurea]|uniref:Pectinesterase inhibitor domain-containing protein n=1 Tax=Genlisea aurea TaxID=192259 RepID=S8EBX0_9LAMI|nr:hypothetical protein M569_01358 [Genlisea aurea]
MAQQFAGRTMYLIAILIAFLSGNGQAASSDLIKKACTIDRGTVDLDICIATLGSYDQISTATTMQTIAVHIAQVGISNSTATRSYIEESLAKPQAASTKATLEDCKEAYDTVIPSFNSALGEIKKDKEYQTATYDLLLAATDYVGECEKSVVNNKMVDQVIQSGNKAVEVFALSAYQIASDLQKP